MNISDIIHGKITTLEVQREDRKPFAKALAQHMEVKLAATADGAIVLGFKDAAVHVVGATDQHQKDLDLMVTRGLPNIVWLAQRSTHKNKPDTLMLRIHEFSSALRWDDPMEIGIDDQFLEDLRRRLQRTISEQDAIEWLTKHFVLPPQDGSERVRVLLSGPPLKQQQVLNAFRLYGKRYAIDVKRDEEDHLIATRVVQATHAQAGSDKRPIFLLTARLSFCPATVASQFRGAARTELDQIVQNASSYLALWEEYNKIEQRNILQRARAFGWFKYTNRSHTENGEWRFDLVVEPAKVGAIDDRLTLLGRSQLQASPKIPASILGSNDEFSAQNERRPFTGEMVQRKLSPPCITVRPAYEDRVPPENGHLFVALGGDQIRIERRTKAWEKIRSGDSPLPQLGLLIEGAPVPIARHRSKKALTASVREVLPAPNDRQRRAIDIALNSPDIVLIQGPPGCGKTRVLAALQARLAEADEENGPDGLSGNTLLTSFQHDAVENAATATLVMGLPAVQIGGRSGQDEKQDGLVPWCRATAEAVRAARAQHAPTSHSVHIALQEVRKVAIAYIQAPGAQTKHTDVLANAITLAQAWLPSPLLDESRALHRELLHPKPQGLLSEERSFVLKSIRGLRVAPIPFEDDGPRQARKALRRLEKIEGLEVSDEDRALLEQASKCEPGEPLDDEQFEQLSQLRDRLIDTLQRPPTIATTFQPHTEVESILARILDALDEVAQTSALGADLAIDHWLNALEHDPKGIREAVEHYSMVLAATCQQAVSRQMSDAKGGRRNSDIVFRSVVIDEAARANPLDLFIPMSLAERRIVLVGDHRQLPHMLEPDIEQALSSSVQEATQHALGRSLFERLFLELQAREKRDGIPRTVTLNIQYRMHPKLGGFVSKHFYEPFGEAFASGLPDKNFEHQVALKDCDMRGKVAGWLDVPNPLGPEVPGKSKSRPVEARVVADQVHDILKQAPDLSIGVIAFYAAQRDQILRELGEANHLITEHDDTGGYRIRTEWSRTSDGRERLRVGTVDAFQGKEFDIVLLSMTRSNKIQAKTPDDLRARFGFLLLENRLCVAMSRQKRLLIVVGDASMVRHAPEEERSLKALSDFLKICEEGQDGEFVRQ